MVARYGGEEFAILAPRTTAKQMEALVLEVQQALAALALPHPTTPSGCVTLSAGVAAHVAQAGEAPESLVAAADRALYQAKTAGRNRAVMAEKNI